MENNKYCVIMAGGIGSRFWPVSRSSRPKQFLDILGTGKSFIRQTFERFLPIVPVENFLIATNASYKQLVMEQIPEIGEHQILCEPVGRNTAPCIAYAAFRLMAVNPESTMIVTPSDHLILNEAEFCKVVGECADFVEGRKALMTIGIKPSRPDTGYGYIQVGGADSSLPGGICKVKTFTEKPNLELAQVFVDSGEFFWNSGIFIWKSKTVIEEMTEHLPELAQLFESIKDTYNTDAEAGAIDRIYPNSRNISIDFGLMEKSKDVFIRCSDFGWSDIGTWGSLYQYASKDDNGNVRSGKFKSYDTKNCIVKVPEGKLVVVDGMDDYIIVDTDDVLMICPKANEQNIKRFVDDVRFGGEEEYI